MLRSHFLKELRNLGFAGIQNFPTVGLIDGRFRQNLEETGMSFALEVECIAEAHAMDLLTTPYVFDPQQARMMAAAGADVLVPHMGLTVKGTVGATTAKSLSQCVDEIRRIADAAKAQRPDVLILCHGGPIAMPEDVQFILDRCPEVDGFYGASSMERLPTEAAISEQVRKFSGLNPGRSRGKSSSLRGQPDPIDSPANPGNDLHPVGVE
jgi:predicted TIM-barrel enzyme